MKTFRYLGEQVVAEADTGLLFCSPTAVEKEWFDPDFDLPFPQDTWESLRLLLERPWFHRLWVVQEIQPHAVVQCGYDRAQVEAFSDAIYCLYSKSTLPPGLRPHLEQATGTLVRLPALCFTRLLYRAATFKACTDPRDKIYGLLGLAPRKVGASVTVDYDESNTATDVYAMTFLNHVEISQRLEHFHNCFIGREMTANAPSWVPDWFSDIPGETYIPAQFATSTSRAHYTVSYSSTMDAGGRARPDVLTVRGKRCGVVNHTSESLPARLDKQDALGRVRRWQPDDLDTATYEPTGEAMRKAYAITLICNILKEREPDWILTPTDVWVEQDFGTQALFGEHEGNATETVGETTSSGWRSDVSDALQCCAERLKAVGCFFVLLPDNLGIPNRNPRDSEPTAEVSRVMDKLRKVTKLGYGHHTT